MAYFRSPITPCSESFASCRISKVHFSGRGSRAHNERRHLDGSAKENLAEAKRFETDHSVSNRRRTIRSRLFRRRRVQENVKRKSRKQSFDYFKRPRPELFGWRSLFAGPVSKLRSVQCRNCFQGQCLTKSIHSSIHFLDRLVLCGNSQSPKCSGLVDEMIKT